MNKPKIPNDWYNLPDTEVQKYMEYLLQNYQNFELRCSPYDKNTNTGLVVQIIGDNCSIQITKRMSDKYKRGGHATQGWVVYGHSDYGYSYDGYNINGKDVFINQKHAHWPEEYPMENPLYQSIHKLYIAVRERTIPTYTQQEQARQQKAEKLKAQHAQRALLETMKNQNDISITVYNKYMEKIK